MIRTASRSLDVHWEISEGVSSSGDFTRSSSAGVFALARQGCCADLPLVATDRVTPDAEMAAGRSMLREVPTQPMGKNIREFNHAAVDRIHPAQVFHLMPPRR
jgi:hypothetical protein